MMRLLPKINVLYERIVYIINKDIAYEKRNPREEQCKNWILIVQVNRTNLN